MNKIPKDKYQDLLDYIVKRMKTGNAEVYFKETNEISEEYIDEAYYYKLQRLNLVIDYHEGGDIDDWIRSWHNYSIHSF